MVRVRIACVVPTLALRLHIQCRCILCYRQLARCLGLQRVIVSHDSVVGIHHGEIFGRESAIRIFANLRTTCRRVINRCRMTGQEIIEVVCGITVLFTAIVFNTPVGNRNCNPPCCNLQRAILRRYIKLIRHIVICGILHHRRAADGVRRAACICSMRIAGRQTAHRVGMATNIEGGCLKTCHTLLRSVINMAGAAFRHYSNRVFLRAVGDGQLARCHGLQRVIVSHNSVVGIHYGETFGRERAIRMFANQCAV